MAKSFVLLKWLAIIVLRLGVHALRLSMFGEKDVFMSALSPTVEAKSEILGISEISLEMWQ